MPMTSYPFFLISWIKCSGFSWRQDHELFLVGLTGWIGFLVILRAMKVLLFVWLTKNEEYLLINVVQKISANSPVT